MTSIRRPSKMEFVMASVCVGAAKPDVAELKTASVKRRFWVYHGRGAGKARWRLCKAADINDPRINPYPPERGARALRGGERRAVRRTGAIACSDV